MKILHVYNHFYPCIGGIENHIENVCTNLIKLGHASDVCCLNRCGSSKKTLRPLEKYKGITIHRIPYKDFKYYKIAPKVLGIIKGYDLIHVHGLGFFLDLLSSTKKMHKKPVILSTHGGVFHTKRLKLLKNFYFFIWSRYKLRNIDRVIAISRNDERIFSKISKNVTFIPNGVDYSVYSKIKRNPEKNTLLFIGRISENKRIDRLIEVVKKLKKAGKPHRLIIAGSDWKGEREKLECIVKKNNLEKEITFLGDVSEKRKLELLSTAGFLVSASEYEGFGISVLEAMAAGVPVIVNDIESFRNFVKDTENGFIICFSNTRTATEKILKIKNHDISKISKNAKETAKKYDIFGLTKEIEKIYGDVLGR